MSELPASQMALQCSQLAQSQQQFQDLKEKFLVSQATVYSLAKQLKRYKLVLAPSIAMKNPPQMEDDPLEGSSTTQWHQVPGNIDASSVAKPKKIKRKLPFSKWFCWTSRSGCRDCDAYHLNILALERDIYEIGEQTIYEEFKLIEELRKYKALDYRQTEQLAQLKYELRKVRDASCSVDQHFEVHLPPDDPDNSERQNLQEQLAKGPGLAEQSVSRLSPENDKHHQDQTDEEVEKAEKSAAPRLSQELLEAKEQKAPEDFLDDLYWTLSVQGDLSDYHQPYSSASSSLENQLTCPALDVASSTQATCHQGTRSGDLSSHLSKVQASQTQLDLSTMVPSFLRIELDQVFHGGNGPGSQGLSSTTCNFTVNVDSDSPLLHYGFLHPQSRRNSLDQTQAVFPTFSGVQSQNQAPKPVLAPSIVMKIPPQMEDDPLEGSSNTQWHQVPGNIDASSVPKPKNIKRKLRFSKWLHWPLRSGCRECDNYKERLKTLQLDIINYTEALLEEELMRTEELREYKALTQSQAEQLAKLQEEIDATKLRNEQLKAHVTSDDPENDKHQDQTDEEGKKAEKSAAPRLSQELLEAKEQEDSEDSLDDFYWALPVQGDLSDYHQPYSSASSSLENQLMCPAVDVASSTQATCPQGTWSGDLSPRLSKVQASQTQLDPSTLVPSCPQELVLAPSIAMKNPLQMEDDPLEGSSNTQWHQVPGNIDASSVPKPKNIKRKFPFSKWIHWPSRSGCRAPSVGMKNAPQLEDDALEGSADTTQGRQVTGNIHASSVSKPKNIKRILPFTLGAVAHTSKPSTLGGRGGKITRSRDQDHPGQHGKTLSLLEKAKIIPALWRSSVVPASWDAETEESLRTQKAEVAVSQDHATVLQPARQSETPTQEKKIKRKLTFSNWICWPSCSGCRAAVTSVWCPVSHGLPFCQALSVPISSLLFELCSIPSYAVLMVPLMTTGMPGLLVRIKVHSLSCRTQGFLPGIAHSLQKFTFPSCIPNSIVAFCREHGFNTSFTHRFSS
nr:neuroblastoma breakpoint family member 19-like isoform X2 [Callithrix jacchus]